jgi:hypothetical protein
VISRSKSGEILISLGPRGNPLDDAAAADAALICRSRIWSAPGPHRRNPALVQMSAVKGRPEMAKRRDWRAGFWNCAPAGRRQQIFGHKEVRYGDNSYPSRSWYAGGGVPASGHRRQDLRTGRRCGRKRHGRRLHLQPLSLC